jgi:2Fe-2S ferredoxin
MPTLKIASPTGLVKTINAATNGTVMEVIRDNGCSELLALCGGGCSCGTCHVYVDAVTLNNLPPPSSDESDLLDTSAHRRPNSRLSCQLQVTAALDGSEFTIAPQD